MPSFTTLYRAIVMVAAGVIVVKGWQLYGPTNEQVKTFGGRAIEMATVAWNKWQPTEAEPVTSRDDPRLAAPAIAESQSTSSAETAPPLSPTAELLPPATVVDEISIPSEMQDSLPLLYARLEELGASDPQLAPWGSSGQMYRFCCRAGLAELPAFGRHFEAVAAQPQAAVEQVVAKVEAWRAIQREGTAARR